MSTWLDGAYFATQTHQKPTFRGGSTAIYSLTSTTRGRRVMRMPSATSLGSAPANSRQGCPTGERSRQVCQTSRRPTGSEMPKSPLLDPGDRYCLEVPSGWQPERESSTSCSGAAPGAAPSTLARPTDAVFRTNHASNYLPLGGNLPADRERILAAVDAALAGEVALRPEWARGL